MWHFNIKTNEKKALRLLEDAVFDYIPLLHKEDEAGVVVVVAIADNDVWGSCIASTHAHFTTTYCMFFFSFLLVLPAIYTLLLKLFLVLIL